MNGFIDFIMGPLVWISLLIFVIGLIARVWIIVAEIKKKEAYIFSYLTLYHSLRSIGAWLIPFFPRSTRQRPWYYGISYVFHLLILVIPLFVSAHIVLVEEAFRVSWPALNDGLADAGTVVVIAALIFFAVRRIKEPDVKYLTSAMDYLLLFMVGLPFVTGFLAYHQVFDAMWPGAYDYITILHILSGEMVLIMIPFSRFSHMVTAPLTRAYTGSEFGNVRQAKDW
jgi:nitrate reductase gamma subunit